MSHIVNGISNILWNKTAVDLTTPHCKLLVVLRKLEFSRLDTYDKFFFVCKFLSV